MAASSDRDVASGVRSAFQASFNTLTKGEPSLEGLAITARAWDVATGFLHPRELDGLSWTAVDHDGIVDAFRWLADAELTNELLKHFYRSIDEQFYLVEVDIATAAGLLEVRQVDDDVGFMRISSQMFERLFDWQQVWAKPLAAFNDPSVRPRFLRYFKQTLHLRLPPLFSDLMHHYFALSFAAHAAGQPLDAPALHPFESPAIPIMPLPTPASSTAFHALRRLGFFSRFGPEITSVAHQAIEQKVAEQCAGEWETPQLESLRQWGRDVVGSWWEAFYKGQDGFDPNFKPILPRIDYHVSKTLSNLRTAELFDIIVSYPSTMPALADLKACVAKVDSRTELVDALQASNVKRLLHPGADTGLIVSQYVSTIRCLRMVDPPGVLLHRVSGPIRRFLKKRPDTVRCIVASLVDDEDGELTEDIDGGIQPLDERNDTVDDYSDPNWEPEPVDAAPEFRTGKASDIVSTLVSIYESRDVIVEELQSLLAQKLLAVQNYDLEKEIRTIEILKLRFGEVALQGCEVMLKDMADSRRTNQSIQASGYSVIQPKIISRHFWPSFPSSSLALPGQMQAAAHAYAQAYHQIKPDKHLRWLPNLGSVTIKLEFTDRTIEAEVTPLQAAVVELFGQQDTWDVKQLALILNVRDAATVLSAVSFWANQGVVERNKSDDTWTVLEQPDEESNGAN